MMKQKPLFSIHYSENTGAYQIYLEEEDAIADLVEEAGKELGFEYIKKSCSSKIRSISVRYTSLEYAGSK